MRARPFLPRVGACAVLVATICSTTAPAALAAPLTSPTAATASRHFATAASIAQELGDDIVRLQFAIHDSIMAMPERLAPSPAVRSDRLNAAGITSPVLLRAMAARTRAVAISLAAATTARQADAAFAAFGRTRRIAKMLYPQLPPRIANGELAGVLESAATEHDRSALAAVSKQSAELAAQHKILPSAVVPGTLVELDPKSPPIPTSDVDILFAQYEASFDAYQDALTDVASIVRQHMRHNEEPVVPPVPAERIVAAWLTAGVRRTNAVLAALTQVGKPYRFASRGPASFDCSGLTSYAWSQANLKLRTSAASQLTQVTELSSSTEMLAGDLVFYKERRNDDVIVIGHVAMSLGVDSLVVEAYWSSQKVQASRFIPNLVAAFGRVHLAGERTDDLIVN